ncbi:hypothetical protein ABT084_23155 [Streptomyces sp. NPDC002138]|uniref:SCO2583 family membrane protein n=1 Tax=Streptomyces sp. NPDC002138 TaxID=3154410 RepID=UPI00332D1139
MAVPGDPPDGTPEGIGGGEDEFRPDDYRSDEYRSDEYRSVVFDEDFVRAARLQEFSAEERMGEHARAVRSRSLWSSGAPRPHTGTPGRAARQGLLLVLLISMAFAVAVYMGLSSPYVPPPPGHAQPLTATVVPLAPTTTVTGGKPADLYAKSPAAEYRVGAAGITLPAVRRTQHFSETQVLTALATAKDYLVQSSLDPDVLGGAASRPVRVLLDPDLLAQFDRSMSSPTGDGQHAATGWLVRFDAATATLADSRVRVSGTLGFEEVSPDVLEVTTDHTFVYTVRGPAAGPGLDSASLFTVRRELRMRFDPDDLVAHRVELLSAYVVAGPQDCSADPAGGFRPLLAGAAATTVGPAVTDPYASGSPRRASGLCGVLAPPPTNAPAGGSASAPADPAASPAADPALDQAADPAVGPAAAPLDLAFWVSPVP